MTFLLQIEKNKYAFTKRVNNDIMISCFWRIIIERERVMSQMDFKLDEFDFYINMKEKEMEVSFPSFVEIDRAVNRSIEIARQFKTRLILIFKEKRLLVDRKSTFKDVMEKYIFG